MAYQPALVGEGVGLGGLGGAQVYFWKMVEGMMRCKENEEFIEKDVLKDDKYI